MTTPGTATGDLAEWITLENAAKLHLDLTVRMLETWQNQGFQTKAPCKRRIYLPWKPIGRTRYVRKNDVLDYLAAQGPTAPDDLIERFVR